MPYYYCKTFLESGHYPAMENGTCLKPHVEAHEVELRGLSVAQRTVAAVQVAVLAAAAAEPQGVARLAARRRRARLWASSFLRDKKSMRKCNLLPADGPMADREFPCVHHLVPQAEGTPASRKEANKAAVAKRA